MAIVVNPRSALPAKLRGLHLFHYGGAPCPQRVRFVLAEKDIRRFADVPWNSEAARHLEAPPGTYIARAVSLPRQQNLSAEYAALHPHMVVPALVHDGVVHIESVDIMNYINDELPGPSLMPEGAPGEICRTLLERASALQPAVRHLTYRFSLGSIAKLKSAKQDEVARLDSPDSPEQLGVFYRKFSNNEIPEATYLEHLRALERGFAEVDGRLASQDLPWLAGEPFSMADIIWAVKTLRIYETGYPFAQSFPHLWTWFDRVRARPGFQEAIWRDVRIVSRVFRAKGAVQNWLGRGPKTFARPPALSTSNP